MIWHQITIKIFNKQCYINTLLIAYKFLSLLNDPGGRLQLVWPIGFWEQYLKFISYIFLCKILTPHHGPTFTQRVIISTNFIKHYLRMLSQKFELFWPIEFFSSPPPRVTNLHPVILILTNLNLHYTRGSCLNVFESTLPENPFTHFSAFLATLLLEENCWKIPTNV